jgi:hypothetical protein
MANEPVAPAKEHAGSVEPPAPSTLDAEMNDLFDFDTPAPGTPVAATPVAPAPIEKNLPGADIGKKEHHVVEGAPAAPPVVPPAEGTPATEPAVDPDEEYRTRMNEMAAQLMKKAEEGEAPPPTPVPAPTSTTPAATAPSAISSTPAPVISISDIFSDADFVALGETPTSAAILNVAFKKMYNHMNEEFNKKLATATQETLRALPPVIGNTVDERVNIRMATADFYRDNPDLKKYGKFVAYTATQLFNKNPDKSVEDVFSLLGKEVRDQLRIKTAAPTMPVDDPNDPGFAGKTRSRKPAAPVATGMHAEMAEMFGY